MPNVAMPAFFIDSLRISRASSNGFSSPRRSAVPASDPPDADLPQDLVAEPSTLLEAGASLTPFQPRAPALLPATGRITSPSTARSSQQSEIVPVSLAAHSIIKSGQLKKHSRSLSGVWQVRHVVVEGHPTHVLVYYYASAASEVSSSKPRGVISLCELSVQPLGKDKLTFRLRAPQRVYDFRAPSADEASEWIRCIEQATQSARLAKSKNLAPTALADGPTAGKISSNKSYLRDLSSSRTPSASSDPGLGSSQQCSSHPDAASGRDSGGCVGSSECSTVTAGGASRSSNSSFPDRGGGSSERAGGGNVRKQMIGKGAGLLYRSRRADKASKAAPPVTLSREETWADITHPRASNATESQTSSRAGTPTISVSEDGSGVSKPPSHKISSEL